MPYSTEITEGGGKPYIEPEDLAFFLLTNRVGFKVDRNLQSEELREYPVRGSPNISQTTSQFKF